MRLRLATRFTTTIAGLLTLSILSSLVALYAAWTVNRRLESAHRAALPSVRAEKVETLLLERDSLVAAQLLDSDNPRWAARLGQLQAQFQQWVKRFRGAPVPADEEEILRLLEQKWADIDHAQQKAVELQEGGNAEMAKTLLLTEIHGEMSTAAYALCGKLLAANDAHLKQIMQKADGQIRLATWVVACSVALTVGLGGTLMWMLLYRVLLPLRGMAADARLFRGVVPDTTDEDELRTMGNYLRELMSDVNSARSRLERSRLRLAAAEKLAAVGKLTATVAHEIRNPLTAMKMWLYAVQEQVRGNADLERKLGIISEEITRLESIVRNFLEFSRPMDLDCRPVEVACIVQRTLDLFEPRLKQREVHIARSGAGPAPMVLADADKLEQVFINLLGNALDAMRAGGEIRIGTSVENDAVGRRMAVVRFRDSGSGMPKEVQARVFEPFFTTKEEGTGLGLCIAAQIMARHEGSLVLESSTESGTTFAVWLPVAKAAEKTPAPAIEDLPGGKARRGEAGLPGLAVHPEHPDPAPRRLFRAAAEEGS